MKKAHLIFTLTTVLATLTACSGPLPPPEPPYLALAKERLVEGHHWFQLGCPQTAEKHFQVALEAARWSDEVILMIRAQNSLGAAALAGGDHILAANYLERALELVRGQAGEPELDKVWANFGSLAWAMGRLEDAAAFWQKAILVAGERGLPSAPYYCDLARVYLTLGKAEFIPTAARALELARSGEKPDPVTLADALNLAGQAALDSGDLSLAETHFRQALELDRQTENTAGLAQDTEALGRLSLKAGRSLEAMGFWDRSFFLWLAVADEQAAERVLGELELLFEQGFVKNIMVYQEALRNPEVHSLSRLCP